MKTDTERSISSPQDDLPEELLPLKDRDFIDVEKKIRYSERCLDLSKQAKASLESLDNVGRQSYRTIFLSINHSDKRRTYHRDSSKDLQKRKQRRR